MYSNKYKYNTSKNINLLSSHLRAFVKEFGDDIFYTDRLFILFNTIYNVKVASGKNISTYFYILLDKRQQGLMQ